MSNYAINYDDKRFTEVEADKKEALSDVENTYGGMISNSDKYYQDQINATKDWEKKQTELQNEQTDFAIEQIEQQKAQAKKDYTKEQSGAYVDWQKQSNQYGANAEQRALAGLANSGYSESSQVSMYNTWQNRVATARDVFMRATLKYDNDMKEARLQNSSALAQIAYESLKDQLELSLQGFQYKNSLVLEMANKKMEVSNIYYQRYQDVLKQINTENALAEQVRQYNATLAEQKRQHNASLALEREKFNWQKAQAAKSSSGSSGGSSGRSSGSIKKSSGSTSSGSKKVSKSAFSGTTYSAAVKYMKENGVSSAADGLMTKGEWDRRKASYNRYGQGNSAVKNYNSYGEYLKDYVSYAMENDIKGAIIGTSSGTGSF